MTDDDIISGVKVLISTRLGLNGHPAIMTRERVLLSFHSRNHISVYTWIMFFKLKSVHKS